MKIKAVVQRLSWPAALAIMLMLALTAGYLAANNLALVTFASAGVLICLLVIYTCLFNPLRGYYLTLIIAFFAFYPSRMLNKEIPLSTFVDVLVLFLFLGTYWTGKADENINRISFAVK